MGGSASIVAGKSKKIILRILKPPRRYLNGMYATDYWEKVALPNVKETLDVLHLSLIQARSVFEAFIDLDDDNSGQVAVDEFYRYLGVPKTKFSERVFGVLDADGSGSLDFSEFLIGIWNYCTYDVRLITKLAFDIFDIDRGGQLDIFECDALLRMVYDVNELEQIEGPPSGVELLAEIDVNGDGEVSIEEFTELMESHMYILAPAFDLQRALRQKILGVKFWERETRVRQALFADADTGSNDSWAAIKEILMKGQEARALIEAEEKARKKATMSEDELRKYEKEKEIELAKIKKAKRAKDAFDRDTLPEDIEEQEAAVELEKAIEVMASSHTYEDLPVRVDARRVLFEAFERVNECGIRAAHARHEFDVRRAAVADAQVATEENIKTEAGRRKLKYEMQLHFGEDMYKSWTAAGGVQASVAPMFKSVDGKSVSIVTALAMSVAPKSAVTPSREHAFLLMMDGASEKLKKKAVKAAVKLQKRKEREFRQAREDLIAVFGSAHTRWEKLFDSDSSLFYWHHNDWGTVLWEEPCICHVCDAQIDNFDIRCFACNTDRSRNNRKFYEGTSALPPLEEEAEDEESDDSDDDEGSDAGGGKSNDEDGDDDEDDEEEEYKK